MFYKEYGQAFREIRQQKGMSLSELEYVSGVPKSTISQFENGHSLISFEKLEGILEAMSITVLDYTLVISNGETEYFITEFSKLEKSFLSQVLFSIKLVSFKQIYETNINNHEKGTDIIAYCAKACYTNLNSDEIQEIEEYFQVKYYWSLFDLRALFYILEQINMELFVVLLSDLFLVQVVKCKYLKEIASYREPLIWILVRSCLVLLEKNRIILVKNLIASMEEFWGDSDLTAKIALQYIKACYQFAVESKIIGEQKVKQIFLHLRDLGAVEIEGILSNRFERLKGSILMCEQKDN